MRQKFSIRRRRAGNPAPVPGPPCPTHGQGRPVRPPGCPRLPARFPRPQFSRPIRPLAGISSFPIVFILTILFAAASPAESAGQSPIFGISPPETLRVFTDIRFPGRESLSRKALFSAAGLCECGVLSGLGSRECYYMERGRLDRALDSILLLYKSKGFLETDVESAEVTPVGAPKKLKGRIILRFDVSFRISEGPRTMVTDIDLFGCAQLDESKVRKEISHRVGRYFNPLALADDIEALERYYKNRGFYRALVRAEPVDVDEGRVLLVFEVDEGKKYSVVSIDVQGNKETKAGFIHRVISSEPGDPYSKKLFERDRRRLYKLGLFSRVSFIETAIDTTDAKLDFAIRVRERKLKYYLFGIGGSSREQEHARILAGWGTKNFLGTGRRLSFKTLGGFKFLMFGNEDESGIEFVRNENNVVFTDPYFFGLPLTGSVEIFHIIDLPPSWSSVERVVNLGLNLHVRKDFGRYTLAILSGELDWINEADLAGEEGTAGEYRNTRALELYYERDSRSNPFEPSGGSLFTWRVRHTGGVFGGDYAFRRYLCSYAFYIPAGGVAMLAARAAGGYIELFDPRLVDVPRNDRLFLGGASSVRGYKEEEMGSGLDEYEGGRVMALAGVEFRFPLVWNFDSAVFVDAGQVWGDLASVEFPDDLLISAGVGLRYRTAIGPIRVDFGFRLNGEPKERIHLSIGHAF